MNITPSAPLFRDPIYDGAADPTIIWNPMENAWWIFYTNRRAFSPICGVSYMHGSDIGIASSDDGGRNWLYRGTVQGLEFESGRNTFWAPEIIEYEGKFHMYVSYVKGVPSHWEYPRKILHYVSKDLWNWEFIAPLCLASDKVIDACVIYMPDGTWKMWYKNEADQGFTYTAYSNDLYHWKSGRAEITDCSHEGPNVFYLKHRYWMITDLWHGLGVYMSHDAANWTRCADILKEPGTRQDDGTIASHADVLVHRDRAYIFYFTHPEVSEIDRHNPKFVWEYKHRRSSLQVAELMVQENQLICNRNHVEIDLE